jgi:hypothetical protein
MYDYVLGSIAGAFNIQLKRSLLLMKLKIVLSIVFILSFACSAAELNVITFADANLEQAIQQELGVDTPVSEQQMLELTTLNAEEYSIQNIDGLRYAKNLIKLYLYDNEISDISELSDLNNLEILFLSNNKISDASPVANLINLYILRLDNNPLNGNISAVSGLTNLTELLLDGCGQMNLSVVSGLKNLHWLSVNNNGIHDIEPLRGLSSLQVIGICDNKISDISAVKDLKELRILQLWNNDVNDISPAAELEYLEELAFINNDVEDISVLANLKNLKMLDMEYNNLNEQAYEEIIPIIKANNPDIKISYTPKKIDDIKETALTPEIKYNIIKSRVIFPLIFMFAVCFTIMIFSEKIIRWNQKR